MTCPNCELLASDTSHLEQVQEWEFQKAELLQELRNCAEFIDQAAEHLEEQHDLAGDSTYDLLEAFHRGDSGIFGEICRLIAVLRSTRDSAQAVIRKYEAA